MKKEQDVMKRYRFQKIKIKVKKKKLVKWLYDEVEEIIYKEG